MAKFVLDKNKYYYKRMMKKSVQDLKKLMMNLQMLMLT